MQTSLQVFNQQPSEKFVPSDGSKLEIVGSPFITIQGEGPYSGQAAIFVRTAGCNLQCPLCDTDYLSDRKSYSIDALRTEIQYLPLKPSSRTPNPLIVITGGEPFRQVLGPFVRLMLDNHYRVQIETNGTLYDESMKPNQFNPYLSIVCSPKARIAPTLKPHITALKYILKAPHINPTNGLPTRVLGNNFAPEYPWEEFIAQGKKVYVQPADEGEGHEEQSCGNLFAAVQSCLKFGYILSLQTHKIIGLD